jgi:hypothetical protein
MDIEIKAKLIGLGLGREGNLVVGLQLRGQMHSCQEAGARAAARGASRRLGARPPPEVHTAALELGHHRLGA